MPHPHGSLRCALLRMKHAAFASSPPSCIDQDTGTAWDGGPSRRHGSLRCALLPVRRSPIPCIVDIIERFFWVGPGSQQHAD